MNVVDIRCYCYNHSYFMKCSKTLFCSSLNTGHGSSDAYVVFSTSIIYSKIKKNVMITQLEPVLNRSPGFQFNRKG